MEKNKINKIVIFVILVSLGLTFRLLPHPWNFTPIAAIALFSGVYLGKKYAFFAPILAMFLSDIFLGFYSWKLMLTVYGSFCLIGLIGLMIKKYKSLETILAGSLSGSVLFFLITNFAVWQFTNWYPKTLSGLIQCYILALPFFRNSLLGDLFYNFIFFGAYESVLTLVRRKKFGFLPH
ncbi:hypothetical protein KJA14_01455 [Patescibacteria group bacterium]|nr:hypothetical protein [Patescibacteria group bacterium]